MMSVPSGVGRTPLGPRRLESSGLWASQGMMANWRSNSCITRYDSEVQVMYGRGFFVDDVLMAQLQGRRRLPQAVFQVLASATSSSVPTT